MSDGSPALLAVCLLGVLAALIQTWRLSGQRRLAEHHEAAAAREATRRVAARGRTERAMEGERRAATLLESEGYAIVASQATGSWTVHADGVAMIFGLRADYLVARDGRRYVAEVKTGSLAPTLSHGPTRRQLLEYGAAFDVDGVLLVDAGAGSITQVEMRGAHGAPAHAKAPSLTTRAIVAALLFCAGVALGAGLEHRMGRASEPSNDAVVRRGTSHHLP